MHELRRMRLADRMTQRQLAAKSGVGMRTIAKIENGTRPRYETRRKLLHALSCPWDLQKLVFGAPPRVGNRYSRSD